MTIAVTMCKLLFAMAVGYYLNKKGVLDGEVNRKLSALIVDVTCPFLIFSSAGQIGEGARQDILFLLLAGAATYCLLPFLSALVVKALRVPADCVGTYRCMMMFSNNAFMGYPVVEALIGSFAIFYTTVFHFGYNLLFYSYGRYIIERDAGQAAKFEPKRLLNGGIIACLLALLLYFTGIRVPDIIMEPVSFVGSVTTPLSMVVIGSNMAGYPLKRVLGEGKMYIVALIRLLLIPALWAGFMCLLTDNVDLIRVVTLTMGMPVGSLVAMGSSKYKRQGEAASVSVVLTTLLSMITIPIMAVILWRVI